ncbi:DNA-binding transcriptional regulator, MerR family [Parapedobacter luteus]|uniref:DNA-binding transcriptional regulator, MerR family n=2 Tax=Sphingobacteriaceae TaxID=84566 RepID=A0A1T5CFS8_9SPHI|nr:DNA-binding transcriptional regulator, MerR family [Parapedobacter luteus]
MYLCNTYYCILFRSMPYKEREINKLYYTMGEVTAMFGVNASQIRFYEREFDVIQPKKNKKGNRLFTPEDIANLKIIFNLVKDKGYTLQGARDYLKNNKSEARENQRVIDSLQRLKAFLLEVRDSL